MIDETLAAGVSIPEEQSLSEHLQSCVLCQEYLGAGTRVIDSLGGFSFEVDPTLHSKVSTSLRLRAQQLEATQPSRRRLGLVCILALVFTVAGSFMDLQFGGLIASLLDIPSLQVRQGLFAFWIVPSLCLLLLFPILPLLSTAGTQRKERTL
jgi:hypothetical protein